MEMKLLVLSPENTFADENEIIKILFDEGLEYFHVRKPSYSKEQLSAYIEKIPPEYHPKMVLHTHHELTELFEIGGIHYNKRAPESEVKSGNFSCSISYHSLNELRASGEKYNYVFLSPVFNSISKEGYKANQELGQLKEFLKKTTTLNFPPIIALGGINENNIETCAQMGFNGVAVLGAVWKNDSSKAVIKKFKTLQNLCKRNS